MCVGGKRECVWRGECVEEGRGRCVWETLTGGRVREN